tara:strand:+ start:2823 stop:3590 length:768 start_codon:yes stop_codon:yes gene_type:complete
MSNIIQSLWVGGELSKMEQLCAKSFVDNGHTYHLYTYGDVKNIPEGVIIKDGNEIVDKSEIFRYKNGSLSAFSNYFRFNLLHKKGGYWVDADVLCVKPFKFDKDIVFVSEPIGRLYNSTMPTSCIIKLPSNSEITSEAIKMQKEHKKLILSGKLEWGSGPATIKHIINKFNLQKYILPWQMICTCDYQAVISLVHPNSGVKRFFPNVIEKYNKIKNETFCIHLWNEGWRTSKLKKNINYHPDSIFELFKKKHNIL